MLYFGSHRAGLAPEGTEWQSVGYVSQSLKSYLSQGEAALRDYLQKFGAVYSRYTSVSAPSLVFLWYEEPFPQQEKEK